MLYQIAALSALAAPALADWQSILDDAKIQLKSPQNEETDDASLTFEMGEAVRTITQTDMDQVNQYGCWCYFQNDYGAGRGKPVDEIDMLCKRLHDGYQCAIMDSANLVTGECIPWEVSYESAVGSGMLVDMDIATIRSECDIQNPSNGCANWVCKIEGYFVQQLVLYFTHGGSIDQSLRHANGFDPKNDCPISTGIDSEKACCDDYPLRFPFKTYNGSRDCCYSHTFNTNLYQCCPDGKVKMAC